MGRYITTQLTYATTTVTTGTSYTAEINNRVLCTSGGITITLPANASLSEGDTVQIIDVAGQAGSSPITVGRNGSLINGLTEDLTIDIGNASPVLVYTGVTYGWVIAGS